MLVFEKVEGIIANCSNSYHFDIPEMPLDGPEFHMLALELNGAAHFHRWIRTLTFEARPRTRRDGGEDQMHESTASVEGSI
jgi:hypothetical protein